MQRTIRTLLLGLSGAVCLGTLVFPAAAQQPASASATAAKPSAATPSSGYIPPPANGPAAVPAGSTLYVRLTTTITDKTNKTGDPFTGEVTKPVTANDKEVVPAGSMVNGHVAFVKPSGRVAGKAELRLVVDNIMTPEDIKYPLSAGLEEAHGGACANMAEDNEGTIKGCGKSKKDALKDAGIGGAMGAGAGATVGLGHEIECSYYGNCGGPGMGADVGYGAAIGASTALIYHFFQHEKHIILIEGTELTFVVNRTASADATPAPEASASK